MGQSDFRSCGGNFGLTRLLFLALLPRFSPMGQLHPGEINFEGQPRSDPCCLRLAPAACNLTPAAAEPASEGEDAG